MIIINFGSALLILSFKFMFDKSINRDEGDDRVCPSRGGARREQRRMRNRRIRRITHGEAGTNKNKRKWSIQERM